jgi:dipeptidyl aminopeptidase/acylaminoacyl peptidase
MAPQFSPDGRRIAFMSNRSGPAEIWIGNSEGTDLVQLTKIGGDWLTTGTPRWSPDGKQIAFECFRNRHFHIYVVGVESRIVHQLTRGSFDCTNASWSRDGHWVYFGSRDQIWKIQPSGGSMIQITRNGGSDPFEASDGKFVYYHREDSIWRVAPTGGDETPVVNHAVPGHWGLLPNGICLLNRWEKQPLLEFFSFADRTRKTFARLPSDMNGSFGESALAASPDGRWILLVIPDHIESSIQLVENFR